MTPQDGRSKGSPGCFRFIVLLIGEPLHTFPEALWAEPVFLIMSDDIEVRRRRAAWRAGHRGTKELDLLVGRFAEERLPSMTGAELARFERFLAVSEPELQTWLLGPSEGADSFEFADVIADIRKFHGLG